MDRFRKLVDRPLARAVTEAEAALPPGWGLGEPELESFRTPAGSLATYGVTASGPGGGAAIAVGVGEAGAYRELARLLRGELPVSGVWTPEAGRARRVPKGGFRVHSDDPDAIVAKGELEAVLSPGWQPGHTDRERYRFAGASLDAYGASAMGPDGEVAVAIALTEADAFRGLARRIRAEVTVESGWAPPVQRLP